MALLITAAATGLHGLHSLHSLHGRHTRALQCTHRGLACATLSSYILRHLPNKGSSMVVTMELQQKVLLFGMAVRQGSVVECGSHHTHTVILMTLKR
jgi:hypothetical protein